MTLLIPFKSTLRVGVGRDRIKKKLKLTNNNFKSIAFGIDDRDNHIIKVILIINNNYIIGAKNKGMGSHKI